MKITFYGATEEVTGSKHLLEMNGKKILLDCGMFYGEEKDAYQKNKDIPFDPRSIDTVILSHAHLDHCGSLPTIYKAGFRGKIFSTPATKKLAELIMLDSAKVQLYNNRDNSGNEGIIYTEKDVYGALSLFQEVDYYKKFKVIGGVEAIFKEAGHILGSAITELYLNGEKLPILGFSGDLGRKNMPILRDYDYFNNVKYLITESTYGGRLHSDLSEAKRILKETISEAARRKSKVIMPAFSLGRTQLLVYLLNQLSETGSIPKIPIYVDSPLSLKITNVFRLYKQYYDGKALSLISASRKLFGFSNLKYIATGKRSKKLNKKRGPMVIISSSGMCEGGRILHHLVHNIGNPNNFIVITGFMAEGTLGRKIEDGEEMILIFGREYKVRAKILPLHSLSAHGDQKNLIDFIQKSGDRLEKVFIVHGEPDQAEALKNKIRELKSGIEASVVSFGQSFNLL